MSHLKERKEKNCLNCNAEINGRYCSVCGQENVEPAESAWHLVTHFFNDITHFDGKFFSTLKYLIFKPGFLSAEYRAGRRASYLNPVRMYVFTSAIFFLIFFSSFHFEKIISFAPTYYGKTEEAIFAMDSIRFSKFTKGVNNGTPMSKAEFKKYIDSIGKNDALEFGGKYKSKKQYDSLLALGKLHDNWFERQLNYKQLEINEKYKGNQQDLTSEFIKIFIHNIPQMLFVSLPLFALFLKLLYSRNKKMYYASHAIFSIHFYVFIFIDFLVIILLNKLAQIPSFGWLYFINVLLYFYIFYYEYKAMRVFYQQRRAKTILKFLLQNAWLLFIMVLIFSVYIFLSFFKI